MFQWTLLVVVVPLISGVTSETIESCNGDPNAVPGCGVNCGRLCSNYNKGPVFCPTICYPGGCDCKKGYVLDDFTNKCVLPEKCSKSCNGDPNAKPGCGVNCGRLCSNYNNGPVACGEICYPGGCDCKEGYVLDDNTKKCVLPEKCTKICNGVNEEYNSCPVTCPPNTCESLWSKYQCPIQPAVCKGACTCKYGFFRNKLGECISSQQCMKCTGPHEYYSCRGACDNVCSNLSEQNQTSCPIINIKCNEMCYCEKGFARDYYGICVPFAWCPSKRGSGNKPVDTS